MESANACRSLEHDRCQACEGDAPIQRIRMHHSLANCDQRTFYEFAIDWQFEQDFCIHSNITINLKLR